MNLSYAKRPVGMAILFSIITCGIYALYWVYQILNTFYIENNQPSKAVLDLILTIVTCGIYGIYLMYKIGKLESDLHGACGTQKDDSVLYLILSIFGLHIIVYAIVQSNINLLADRTSGGTNSTSSIGPGNENL